jgi:hypothetical protein
MLRPPSQNVNHLFKEKVYAFKYSPGGFDVFGRDKSNGDSGSLAFPDCLPHFRVDQGRVFLLQK